MDKKIKFKKYDNEKIKYSLVPSKTYAEIASILTFGANKYGKDNWKLCKDVDRFMDAAIRHIESYRNGDIKDIESGISHLSHAITNLIFINELKGEK